VVAWGSQTQVPTGLTNVVAIAAGSYHSVALRGGGTVTVWGSNAYDQANVPAGLSNVVAIAAGTIHSLALRADGTVVAWGAGGPGTSGHPHYGQSVPPAEIGPVVAIAVGSLFSLAVIGEWPPLVEARLANPTLSNGVFSVLLPTRRGKVYALEFKNSLSDDAWTALPLVLGEGGPQTLTHPSVTTAVHFYRVREW
jgi:alpha-tubulin suppressor-like RCC1 family protein